MLFKKVFAPSPRHTLSLLSLQRALTFNRPSGEDVETVQQSFSESELQGYWRRQTRQLFMGDDSLQISQSVERHSG